MKRIVVPVGFVIALALSALSVAGQTQSREDILKQLEAKRSEIAALEKRFLAPSEEDQTTYADFLRLPDTGLIRLLPREKYDTEAYKDGTKYLTMRGGGAYYSFSRLTHEYGFGSDIELDHGRLSTGFAGADYGLLTDLSDTPLENVSLESAAGQVFANYSPAEDEPRARIEQRRTSEGATSNGVSYKRSQQVRLNSTYLLRSVNYGRSDVLVAFRIVRIDNDDSVTILWKQLKKYPTPYLARN